MAYDSFSHPGALESNNSFHLLGTIFVDDSLRICGTLTIGDYRPARNL